MPSSESLESRELRRTELARLIAELGDLSGGSITATSGMCGKANCQCHQPKG